MKHKLFLFFFSFFVSTLTYSQEIILNTNLNSFDVLDKSENSFSFNSSVNRISYKTIKTEEGNFTKLIIPSYTSSSKIGSPEMLMLNKLISIPKGIKPVIEIINSSEQLIKLDDYNISLPIFPKQPSISKGDKLEDIKFYYDNFSYEINDFSMDSLISFSKLGKRRGVDLSQLPL